MQKEELGNGNVQISPPGFHVIYIPYAEDIRRSNLKIGIPKGLFISQKRAYTKKYCFCFIATTQQIDKAKEVIKKLTFEFQSESFENPGILHLSISMCVYRVGGHGKPLLSFFYTASVGSYIRNATTHPYFRV